MKSLEWPVNGKLAGLESDFTELWSENQTHTQKNGVPLFSNHLCVLNPYSCSYIFVGHQHSVAVLYTNSSSFLFYQHDKFVISVFKIPKQTVNACYQWVNENLKTFTIIQQIPSSSLCHKTKHIRCWKGFSAHRMIMASRYLISLLWNYGLP